MKQMTKLALMGALGICLMGVAAYAQNTDPAQGADPGAPPRGPGAFLLGLLDKYDVNHDGQLDANELAAFRKDIEAGNLPPPPGGRGPRGPGGPPPLPKDILDKYDVNHDGKLDETERAALHKDIQEGKIQLPFPGGRAGGPGGPGFKPATAAEVIAKFDADKDGKLDEAELTAFLDDMKSHRPGPGRRGPGGPPPGDVPQQ
jgi:Ca2+-binding EF-hand superfamily protein